MDDAQTDFSIFTMNNVECAVAHCRIGWFTVLIDIDRVHEDTFLYSILNEGKP